MSDFFTPEVDFQELRERISINSVASQYVTLKKSGENTWKGLCPFHTEKTPSFVIDSVRKSFMCFGCGSHGDVIDLKSKIEGISISQAVKELKEEAGIIDAFVPHTMRKTVQAKQRMRQEKMKRFHLWRSKLVSDLITYTNTQWRMYRIAKRQSLKNTTEELEAQIETCYYEATTREKALDELETMSDADLLEWYDTQKSWEKGGSPKWVLTGWRKNMVMKGSTFAN